MKARNKILLHYDAILFDVDGTLIDSAPGIIHTLQEVFCTMGVDVSGINLRRYLGPPLRKSFGEHFTDPALIEKAIAHTEAIILSMTPEERENPQILGASRKKRIAAGCGLDVVDVNRLLKQFEGMQQIIKQVTGGRKPGFGFGGLGHGRGLRKRKKK